MLYLVVSAENFEVVSCFAQKSEAEEALRLAYEDHIESNWKCSCMVDTDSMDVCECYKYYQDPDYFIVEMPTKIPLKEMVERGIWTSYSLIYSNPLSMEVLLEEDVVSEREDFLNDLLKFQM